MNDQQSNLNVSPSDIDRLVDGELNEEERRELLELLEQQPQSWRQCALAFVESQMWAADISQLTSQCITDASVAEPKVAFSERAAVKPNYFGWIATAATVVAAFSIGQSTNQNARYSSPTQPLSTQVVNKVPVGEESANATPIELPPESKTWLTSSDMPRDVERWLEGVGAHVKQEEGWLLRRTADGPTVVPFKDVQIVPVRGPAF